MQDSLPIIREGEANRLPRTQSGERGWNTTIIKRSRTRVRRRIRAGNQEPSTRDRTCRHCSWKLIIAHNSRISKEARLSVSFSLGNYERSWDTRVQFRRGNGCSRYDVLSLDSDRETSRNARRSRGTIKREPVFQTCCRVSPRWWDIRWSFPTVAVGGNVLRLTWLRRW